MKPSTNLIPAILAEHTVRISRGNLCALLTAWVPNGLITSKDIEVRCIITAIEGRGRTVIASGAMLIYDDPGTGSTLYGAVVEEGRPGVSSAFRQGGALQGKELIYQILVTRKGVLQKEENPQSAVIVKSPEYSLDIAEGIRERFGRSLVS